MDIQKVIDCYVNENMSTYQIARKFKTYPNKVRRELIKSGITIRDHSEAQAKALGMSLPELSDMLFKQEYMKNTAQEQAMTEEEIIEDFLSHYSLVEE